MPDYTAGTTRIYVRPTQDHEWVEWTDYLVFASPVTRVRGNVSSLTLGQSYTEGPTSAPVLDIEKSWLKVTHQPDGGSETLIWYGDIEETRILEQGQNVQWIAVSLEAQLQRVRIWEGYSETLEVDGFAMPIGLPRFNEELDSQGRLVRGRRSTKRYHFAEGGMYLMIYLAGDDSDVAYVFGTDAFWRAGDILEFLLAAYAPPGGREDVCEVGFRYSATTVAQAYLDGHIESWDFTGKTLLEAVESIVKRAGPLMWWLDATAFDAGTDNYITLQVASRLWGEHSAPQTVHNIETVPAEDSPAMPAMMRRSTRNRLTRIIARGARLKVMFSVKSTGTPYYEEGWDPEEEANYLAVQDDPEADKSKWADVFTNYIIPYNQTAAGISSWRICMRPNLIAQPEEDVGDRILGGAGGLQGLYPHPRKLLTTLLTYQGWTSPTANDGTFPAPSETEVARPEHDPILCWFMSGEESPQICYRLKGVRRLTDQAGIYVPANYRRPSEDGAGVDLSLGTNSEELRFTVAVELDRYLEWSEPMVEWGDDQCRVELIHMPECEWWAARQNTIIDIAKDGTESYVYGVLRNDLPRLRAAALARSTLLNQTTGAGKVKPSYFGQIPLKWPSLDYQIGDMVEYYGPWNIQMPIAQVTHEFRNTEIYSTTLITDKPLSAADMP